MKKQFLTLSLAFFSLWLYGQNENPFSQFGYEAPIMKNKKLTEKTDVFIIQNPDSSSAIGYIFFDVKNRKVVTFDNNDSIISIEKLHATTISRWLTTDPAKQYHSPYLGMGNNPISGIDPDGRKKVHYNGDGSYSGKTTHNNWFHNTFFGIQNYIDGTKVSDALFWSWQSDLYPSLGSSMEHYALGLASSSEMVSFNGAMVPNPGCNPALELAHPEEFVLSLGVTKLLRSGGSKIATELVDDKVDDIAKLLMKDGVPLKLKPGQEINYMIQNSTHKLHFRVETHGNLSKFVGHNNSIRHANIQLFKKTTNGNWKNISNTLENSGHVILDPN